MKRWPDKVVGVKMRLSTPLLALGITVFGALVIGCGGGGGSFSPGGTTGGNPYAGTFTSTAALDGGKTGTTSITVARDGKATGTLTVTAGALVAPRYSFAAGVYNITGTVDPDTGEFTMTGDIPGLGPFSYSGILPAPGRAGSYTITAGGDTWSGTFGGGGSTNGSTNASTDGTTNGSTNGSNTTTTGTTSGTAETFQVGATVNLQVSANTAKDSDGNAESLSILATPPHVGVVGHAQNQGGFSDNAAASWQDTVAGTTKPIYNLGVAFVKAGSSAYRTGIITADTPDVVFALGRVGGFKPSINFILRGGQVTVTRADKKAFAATFENAVFEPLLSPSYGTGRFTLNGTMTLQ